MDHLVKLQSQVYDELVKKFSAESYNLLAKTTLIRVQLFNRRRPGETVGSYWKILKCTIDLARSLIKI